MNNKFMNLQIQRKSDGTFIVDNNGAPFHLTDDYPLGEITSEAVREYIKNGGEFTEYVEPTFEITKADKLMQQISKHKAELTATDYKVIKSVEQGIQLDDNFLAARQRIRDEINALENELINISSK